jgi:transcriptional regulator with XRE-family HTH domain
MDAQRVGRAIRAIRHRRGWRQQDLADRAGESQDIVSRVERGRLDRVPLHHLEAIARALEAEVVVSVRWRGADLDRLLDEHHAALVGRIAARLGRLGWEVRPEITYSIYGERGAIDLLAFHRATATLPVVEVKTDLVSVEETLRRHDAKARLALRVAKEQLGWTGESVGRLLVLPEGATVRRRVERHDDVLRRSYPARQEAIRRWPRTPTGPQSGLLFMPIPAVRPARKRIRGSRCSAASGPGR